MKIKPPPPLTMTPSEAELWKALVVTALPEAVKQYNDVEPAEVAVESADDIILALRARVRP
jgi:hypothetical protein